MTTEPLFYESPEMLERRGCDPWLAHQLPRFRYKPRWRGYLSSVMPQDAVFGAGQHRLTINFVVNDTYHPGEVVMVRTDRVLPGWDIERKDEYWLAHVIMTWLIDTERHEAQEWFRRDGEIFDNPHKPKALVAARTDELDLAKKADELMKRTDELKL